MSESEEDTNTVGVLRTYRTPSLPKNKPGFFGTHKSILHDDLDKNCLYTLSNSLIRIEYPGRVKNIDRAIETLGGIQEIHSAINDGRRLELKLNPDNQYNKGAVADKDESIGILIKVTQHDGDQEYSYEILGATGLNFRFNRMCDFQYLPLVAKSKPEHEESEVEYLYDKIVTDKIPSLEWFTKREPNNSHPAFLVTANFARFDLPQAKFQLNSADTLISIFRPDLPRTEFTNKKEKEKLSIPSIQVSFTKPGVKIPDQPLTKAMKFIKEKVLQKHYTLVKNLFQERPIWRKAAIMCKTKISDDAAKYVLPCVGYYCISGPWRSCWIRYGYNPTMDYNSRTYQILDFRIRSSEGMQMKVKAKRQFLSNLFKGKAYFRHVTEKDYSIKPNQLPPARQMFYQYCDILLPEVQQMLLKLPKLPPAAKYDIKNGWLPLSFQEHCREIVNKYIFDAVQQELSKESQSQSDSSSDKNSEAVSSYCSKMLSNIKRGVFQSIGEYSGANTSYQENIIEEIDLSDDDEDELEQIDANEVVNSLPERIPDNFDDNDDESDLEIDMEAVEEVNKIVSGIKDTNLTL